jgi:hypothetical protein
MVQGCTSSLQASFDALADAIEGHMDVGALLELALAAGKRNPTRPAKVLL